MVSVRLIDIILLSYKFSYSVLSAFDGFSQLVDVIETNPAKRFLDIYRASITILEHS